MAKLNDAGGWLDTTMVLRALATTGIGTFCNVYFS